MSCKMAWELWDENGLSDNENLLRDIAETCTLTELDEEHVGLDLFLI